MDLQETLSELVKDMIYFSESEYPLEGFTINVDDAGQIPLFLSSYKNTDAEFVKQISAAEFFERFDNYISMQGPDEVMNDNAQQFVRLKKFLAKNFEDTLIYRVQKPGEAVIPIFIIGKSLNGEFAGLETTAIET